MRKNTLVKTALLLALVSATAVAQEPLPPTEAQADWNFAPPQVGQFPADMAASSTESCLTNDLDCCFNACRVPCVYFQADALYWDRVGVGCSETLVIDTDDNSALFATDDLSFNGAPGARFLVGWQPGGCSNCCAWELSYWGLYNWNTGGVVNGAGDLAIPGDLGLASNNFFLADTIEADYRSEIHNVEFNCIKSCCTGCTGCARIDFIGGLRYIALRDSLSLTATDLQEGQSSYDIDVHNNLYGFQLGGRYTRPLCCKWGVELTSKAALFYNDVTTDQLVTDFPNTPTSFVLRDAEGSRDGVAALGEVSVVLIRPISNHWNLRLGYTAIGLGGVGLAGDQVDFTDTLNSGTEVNNTGWIFAHGALAGMELRW